MKKGVDENEAWPVYSLYDKSKEMIEISQEEINWVEKVEEEYEKVQEFLQRKYKEAGY